MRSKVNFVALLLLMFVGTSAFAQTTYKLVLDCEYGPAATFANTTIVLNYKRTIYTFSGPGGPIIPQVSNLTATEYFAPGRQYYTITQNNITNGFVIYEITGMSISYEGVPGSGVPNQAQLDQINTCCYSVGEPVYWGTHRADILNQSDGGNTWIYVRMVQ